MDLVLPNEPLPPSPSPVPFRCDPGVGPSQVIEDDDPSSYLPSFLPAQRSPHGSGVPLGKVRTENTRRDGTTGGKICAGLYGRMGVSNVSHGVWGTVLLGCGCGVDPYL